MSISKAEKRNINRTHKQVERDKKREAGLVPIEVWIKPEYKKAIRDYAKDLNEYEG